MFGEANSNSTFFVASEIFGVTRNTGSTIPFGASPHFCVEAAASQVLITEVALQQLFKAFPNLELTDEADGEVGLPWPAGSESTDKFLRAVKYANRTAT